jgi:hypothetical protein
MKKLQMTVICNRCRHPFRPDMHTKGPWLCPNCQAPNPNLRRHFRAIGGLCILGFLTTLTVLFICLRESCSTFQLALGAGLALLFLITVFVVYKTQTPWANPTVRNMLWTVFGLAFLLTVVAPLTLMKRLNLAPLLLHVVVFPYFFWVYGHARRSEPAAQQDAAS